MIGIVDPPFRFRDMHLSKPVVIFSLGGRTQTIVLLRNGMPQVFLELAGMNQELIFQESWYLSQKTKLKPENGWKIVHIYLIKVCYLFSVLGLPWWASWFVWIISDSHIGFE